MVAAAPLLRLPMARRGLTAKSGVSVAASCTARQNACAPASTGSGTRWTAAASKDASRKCMPNKSAPAAADIGALAVVPIEADWRAALAPDISHDKIPQTV